LGEAVNGNRTQAAKTLNLAREGWCGEGLAEVVTGTQVHCYRLVNTNPSVLTLLIVAASYIVLVGVNVSRAVLAQTNPLEVESVGAFHSVCAEQTTRTDLFTELRVCGRAWVSTVAQLGLELTVSHAPP
jgi:hypothetical protein